MLFSDLWGDPPSLLIDRTVLVPSQNPYGSFGWITGLPEEMLRVIGHLAVVTAQAEELLHQIYWKHAGLNDKSGPIVTDNINPKRLMEDALKFASLNPSASKIHQDLEIIFKEFEDINTKRNHCLHWVWEIIESKPEMGTGLLGAGPFGYRPPPTYQVKRPIYRSKGIETEPFSTADIQGLCNDASWLVQRFRSHTLSEGELRRRRSEPMRGAGKMLLFREHREIAKQPGFNVSHSLDVVE